MTVKPAKPITQDEIESLGVMLRRQGVSEFSCSQFTIKFDPERAYLKSPLIDNTPQPDSIPASKREEVKQQTELDAVMFHSTPF